ncbi:MAG: flippase [Patescibacteria group bacterium]|nr:flippase [Patescibacteria group bacterium]
MSNKIQSIAKNTSYFTLALILQKIISFSYFTILARNFVPEDLGKYYTAISFTTIFAILIDLGLANVLTREIAKAKNKAKDLLSAVIIIKLPLTIISILSALIIANLLGYPELTRRLIYLSVISMALDSFTLAFYAAVRGLRNLKFESIGAVVFQIIVLLYGLIVIRLGLGLLWLISAPLAASLFNFLYSFFIIRLKYKISFNFKFNPLLFKAIIGIAVPFALYGIFQRLYMYLDTVLLSILAGDKFVGLYQIPFKIIFALQFLPMAFMASLYPAFAAYWKDQREETELLRLDISSRKSSASKAPSRLVVSFERAMNYLIIISLPISFGIITLADKIIRLFKSEYMEAILPLQIVIAALFFIFINFPIGSLLNACDRQKANTRNMGLALAASIILNIILIPKFQTIGASVTVVATNFLLFILGMRIVPRIITVRLKKIFLPFIKALAAAAIMAGLIMLLKDSMNIFILVPLAGLAYFAVLFALKGFRKEDVVSIFESFSRNS